MSKPKLVIGNMNYSSWSLRPWLALAKLGVDFETVRVSLYEGEFKQTLYGYSPAGLVPIYIEDGLTVWDSLAILERLAEQRPSLWPDDPRARAHARSVSAEMHSGFAALRGEMPMNCRAVGRRVPVTDGLAKDIRRIHQIWTDCRATYGGQGPWLFGGFTIADAMFAPVVFRFRTYGVECPPEAAAYMKTAFEDPCMQRWLAAGCEEPETIDWVETGAG